MYKYIYHMFNEYFFYLAKKKKVGPKNIRESKPDKENEKQKSKNSRSKVLKGSKKIKKTLSSSPHSPKTRSRTSSCDGDLRISSLPSARTRIKRDESKRKSLRGNDINNKIRRLVKASKNEDVFVENWLKCDDCGKWRKITDGKVNIFFL